MTSGRDAPLRIRQATPGDLPVVMALAVALWPEEAPAEIEPHMRALLAGQPRSTLPLSLIVAERNDQAVGFIEVGLRSHAEGCDGVRPAGFIEGWFVVPAHRGRGVGRALMTAAEDWARAQGCTELGSDTWIDNDAGKDAHLSLGFAVVERMIAFRKSLVG
jgi:aminoglycoside 6'-N-acetyltransferase I